MALILNISQLKKLLSKLLSVGEIPSPVDVPPVCSFNIRYPFKTDICFVEDPVMREIEPEHNIRCHDI